MSELLRPGGMFGDLRVVSELGRGGMGAVYLVEDPETCERYAAKILFPEAEQKDHDNAVARFLREAEVAMAVDHPNLVKVYDVGRDPETSLGYILMEYVPGGSLHDRLMERLVKNKGPFPVKEALAIVRVIAGALAAAEEHGIVHRDIKPDNILFDAAGVPRLADLGVAKRRGVQMTMTLTMTDMVVGTPAYMAPEQLLDSKRVDSRADIYSLGIVLWQLLAGERPNDDLETGELMARAVRKERIPDIRLKRPKISRRVRELLRRMTAPRLEQRFQHPSEIVDFLDCWAARERRRVWLLGGCALALALAVYAVVAWMLLKSPETASDPKSIESEEFAIPESVD